LLPAALSLAAILGAASASAQEFQPYPEPKITAEQFARYADEVRQAFLATAEIDRVENVVVFSDTRTRTFWIFTTKDNPAHPAWITRQMVEDGGQVKVRQIGYFAGSEPEFAKLFRYYQDRNAQLVEDVQRRNQ
jgi:voltage-gated potassium channel Kch